MQMRGSQVRLASRRGLQAGWVCTAQAIQACRADEDCSAGRIAEQVRLVRFAEQVRLARRGVTPRLRYADARQPGGQRRRGVQYRRGSVAQRRLEQQQHEARVRPVSKPSPVRPASAALPVDGQLEACSGAERGLRRASLPEAEPACFRHRVRRELVCQIGEDRRDVPREEGVDRRLVVCRVGLG